MKVYRYNPTTQQDEVIFNIMEGTYTGKDMGERSITATIEFPSRIDFQIGDYVKIDIANLLRTDSVYGGHGEEKFYIYTMPTVKKIARRLSHGKAFQHTVTFYPCQYELAAIKMRDLVQEEANGIIYTGYDEFSFYGGANTLMKRIMAVLNERFGTTGVAGVDYWTYFIADAINEDKNTALEKFQFDFSDNSVMDALLKLNEAEGINTKFFINGRTIYVGYKRPYITGVDSDNVMRDIPFEFMYGKTSHLPESTNHGNLFTLTKSNGQASPITRLYAYGSDRNLHRFYCSDRIKSGRYVNKLMLPSFEDDGRTDYIDSEEGIARFGIREGSKTFDKIYPSLRNFYYGNIRDIKYCIKLMGSGLEGDAEGAYDGGKTYVKSQVADEQQKNIQSQIDSNNAEVTFIYQGAETKFTLAQAKTLMEKGKVVIYKVGSSQTTTAPYQYPVARVQCYRVVELMNGNTHTGLNTLVECAPPVDLAVFCHATGKVVKCVLYADDGEPSTTPGMTRAEERQYEADGQIPVDDNGNYIVGSCFAVHDSGFQCGHTHLHLSHPDYPYYCDDRRSWFINQDEIDIYTSGSVDANKEKYRNQVSIHQINYTDDHWITDVYEFTSYNQQSFNRQGYSAYCWPRINKYYPESQADNVEVSAVVDVGPVYIEDTDLNRSEGQAQATFDIYLRDVGFKINEQTWFGDKVFLFDTVHINFLDGNLAGYSFEMPGESDQASLGDIYVPALLPDGSRNEEFFTMADSPEQAEQAYLKGAYWRIVAKRCDTEVDNYWMPNINVNAKAGDHVVFLDIFMPDIYIRVAEQRLLKEAQKYLDANDDGDIQYSFDFDKVRLNDQPVFALQMREGAIMRVVDDDLDVGMVNQQKTVFEDKDGLVSAKSMIKTDVTVVTDYDVVNRDADELMEDHVEGYKMTYDSANDVYVLEFDTLLRDADKDLFIDDGITLFYRTGDESCPYVYFTSKPENNVSVEHIGSGDTVARHRLKIRSIKFLGSAEPVWDGAKWWVQYSFKMPSVTPQTNQYVMPIGQQVFCPANNLTDFKGGKYYEIIMDALESDMTVLDSNGVLRLFALVNGLGEGETFFRPDYTLTDITTQPGATYKRYKISFTLDESFNDVIPYYPAFLYESDGETEAVHVRLWSILERDDEALEDLNYVDLAIDTVTIKFHDNTREAGVSLQDGQEPERLIDHVTEMTREVTATVKEESRASAWAQLMNRVADTEIVESQTLDFYETLVNASRRYYNELMALKGSLFDPDGTCNEVFLQIMMLQVGVDSMNYQLKYTHYSITGQRTNCGIIAGSDPSTEHFDAFYIGDADEVLDHFAFTQNPTGGAGGRWYPQKPSDHFILGDVDDDNNPIFPTYFVALKAHKANPNYCYWVCETTQHMVNEDENYFYFNWGILVAGDDGHYTLTETRGNAYMYGDNLICGKISTLARDSYFDLTQGNFVLSKNNVPSLSYVNGLLTISGLNDEAGIGKIIKDLGLQEIGGENLIENLGRAYSITGTYAGGSYLTIPFKFINYMGGYDEFPAGKYVFSAEEISVLKSNQIPPGGITVLIVDSTSRSYNTIATLTTGENVSAKFELSASSKLFLHIAWAEYVSATVKVNGAMLQLGDKPTSYQDYVKHITDVIKNGSTEIVGGLLMTNLLMLKDDDGHVVAGMSGKQDTEDYTYEGEDYTSEGVTLWSGGSYNDALMQAAGLIAELLEEGRQILPILLTKTGAKSRIGCFQVDTANQASIVGADGTSKFVFNTGDENTGAYMSIYKSNNEIIRVTSDEIHPEKDSVEFGVYGKYDTPKVLVENSTPKSSVVLDTLSVAQKTNFKFNKKDATHIYFSVYVASSGGSGQATFTISFNVKIGGVLLKSVSYTVQNQYNYSDIEFVSQLSNKNINFASASSEKNLEITDISITSGGTTVYYASLKYFAFCYREDTSQNWSITNLKYAHGLLYSADIKALTILGKNGLSAVGADGTTINFLYENGTLVFRAIGLPEKKKSERQVINSNYDVSRIKKEFQDAASMWSSWNDNDRKAFFGNVATLLPNELPTLSVQ